MNTVNIIIDRRSLWDLAAAVAAHQNSRDKHKGYRLAIKTEVLTHYGNGKLACMNCGFSDIRALCIDHINGKELAESGSRRATSGYGLYMYLRSANYPSGYQTLCFNCNTIKKSIDYNWY